jgi:hypothetical protein
MRHRGDGWQLEPPRGFDARRPLDYLAIVIKRGEVSMLSMAVTRFGPIRPLRALSPRGAASCAGLFAAALLLAVAPAAATTYKWTDGTGRVIYSDQPPAGNFKVEEINAPPPPANPNAVKDLANKDAEIKKQKLLRVDEEAKATKARVEANLNREQCERVRGQIITLGQSSQLVIYTTDAQGQRTAMDDAAIARERLRLDAWFKDNCKG